MQLAIREMNTLEVLINLLETSDRDLRCKVISNVNPDKNRQFGISKQCPQVFSCTFLFLKNYKDIFHCFCDEEVLNIKKLNSKVIVVYKINVFLIL